MKKFVLLFLSLFQVLFAEPSTAKQRALYHTLDPYSIEKQFAYYQVYPDTFEGKKAFTTAWDLLNKHRKDPIPFSNIFTLIDLNLQSMIDFVNKRPYSAPVTLNKPQLSFLEKLSNHLSHRKLKGHSIEKIVDIMPLKSEEVDLARAILLYQFKEDLFQVRQYEASLDLMALQILARLPHHATDLEKIAAINQFIFHEKGFRFPPHSFWVKDIDLYTFLPSVLDSRHGVCLGVSILYLCLSQRLDLPLDIITPPGHIYLSYTKGESELNIETTARGVHIPTKQYIGVNALSLPHHDLKEVVGLNFINQASIFLHKKKYTEALELYLEAEKYVEKDHFLSKLIAITYTFLDHPEKAKPYLEFLSKNPDPTMISQDKLVHDLLEKRAGKESLDAIFEEVDETKQSILDKQKKLLSSLEKYPKCTDALFHVGITWLQLSRYKEALEIFELCLLQEPNHTTALYYATILCIQRHNYPKAVEHFNQLKSLVKKHPDKEKFIHPIDLDIQINYCN